MKICIPIKENSSKKVSRMLLEASIQADLAEIWLDQIKDLDIKKLLYKVPLPIVAVCKRKVEKGNFTGTYEAQSKILIDAIKNGASYVDIPLFIPEKMNKKIVQVAKKTGVKVIISHHDFKNTQNYKKMLKLAEKMVKKGADIIKLACNTKSLQDTIEVIGVGKYLQGQKIPHILIGMGQKGILSRILTPTLGGEIMFAVLDKKGQTAQGQMTVSELKKAWSLIKSK